jgi:hypothetical protein
MVAVLAVVAGGDYLVSNPDGGTPGSRLAGYTWCCKVKEVSARWVVPKVFNDTTSSESQWIGVQDGFGAHPRLFLQVGVVITNLKGLQPEYFAFWSDPERGFHAVLLQVLVPGDVVDARLAYRRHAWTLRIEDGTTVRSLVVGGLASPGSDFAEWFEEDPSASLFGSHFAEMPDAQTSRFEKLMVNGSLPGQSGFNSQGFNARGVTYYPTSVSRSGGFTIAVSGATQ